MASFKDTKKINCPVKIKLKEVIQFPEYNMRYFFSQYLDSICHESPKQWISTRLHKNPNLLVTF